MTTTRRKFLIGSVAIAGGFVIGYKFYKDSQLGALTKFLNPGQQALTPYVIIDTEGITIVTPRAEMGQGIHSTLATLVAEELDVSITEVKVVHGPASSLYANYTMFPKRTVNWKRKVKNYFNKDPKRDSRQLTGGQTSIRDAFHKMRQAGAAAREVLIKAAAKEWGTNPESLTTTHGMVVNSNGAQLRYVELAKLASTIQTPQNPSLKLPSQWNQLGKSQPRIDMRAKCQGQATYSIDIRLPNMLYGAVRLNPYLGGDMISYQADKALGMDGVEKIIPLKNGIVVCATNTWYAFEAAKSVDIEWEKAPYPESLSSHRMEIKEALNNEPNSQPRDLGQIENFAERTNLSGEYWVPYLAHANMEPLNAVANFDGNQLHIWAGTQFPTNARLAGADILELDIEDVQVYTTYMGCGFGRRLEIDFIQTAVYAAKALAGIPIKVTWSREEDMTHDVYRPMAMAKFRAFVEDGKAKALDIKVSSPSLLSSFTDRGMGNTVKNVKDKFITAGIGDQPYQLEHYRVSGYRAPDLLPAGWLRSVGESQNSFFSESIIDEIAHSAGTDPLQFRLDLLKHQPSRKVLSEVARISNWGKELPANHVQGLAYVLSSDAATAQVIEVKNLETGIEIIKVFAAVDVGIALDPKNIEAQVSSGIIFGLSAAINGEITVSNGRVDQTNFHNYSPLRIYQTPPIEVIIVESGKEIYGVGEAGTPAAAPALGNAIFSATGQRIRELPFAKYIQFI